jgi:hypothetical protein
MNIVKEAELVTCDCSSRRLFPQAYRKGVLHYIRKQLKTNSLGIPKNAMDESVKSYLSKGTWFHVTPLDLIKAHRKARKRGITCNPLNIKPPVKTAPNLP